VVERERGRAADVGAIYVLNGKQRFRNGYLQRSIAIRSLIILSTVPPLDELQRYKQVKFCSLLQDATCAASPCIQTRNTSQHKGRVSAVVGITTTSTVSCTCAVVSQSA